MLSAINSNNMIAVLRCSCATSALSRTQANNFCQKLGALSLPDAMESAYVTPGAIRTRLYEEN